jgi:hypothetical protein
MAASRIGTSLLGNTMPLGNERSRGSSTISSGLQQPIESGPLLRCDDIAIGFKDGVGRSQQAGLGEFQKARRPVSWRHAAETRTLASRNTRFPHTPVCLSWGIESGSRPSFLTSRRATA